MSQIDKMECITRFNATDEIATSTTLAHGEVVCFSTRSPSKLTPNEDALAVIPVNEDTTVLVVADGLGGMPRGEQASKTVIECLIESLDDKKISIREAILNGIDNANREIMFSKSGSGTTVSIAELTGNKLRTYHAGDSLILLTTSHGNIRHQSLSHSPIGYALVCGAINSETAMLHPERNLISNYVGCADMHINIGPIVELAPLDTLILSSDGLSDNLYENEICEYIRKGDMLDRVNEMVSQCRENMIEPLSDRRCHPDDLTLISFRQHN